MGNFTNGMLHGFSFGMLRNMQMFCMFPPIFNWCGCNTFQYFSVPNIFMSNFCQYPTFTPQMPPMNFSINMNESLFNGYNMSNFDVGFDKFQPSWSMPMQFETVCSKKTTNNKSSKSSAKHWTKMTDEEMKEVYGNYTKEIVGECNVSVEKLNEYLKDKGVLKDKGQAFLDAEKEYNINAVALIAICMNESNKGSSDLAKNKNNVGGVRKSGSTEFMEFDKVENCIDYMAKLLKNNYVDNGLKKLYQVNAKYCPSAETQSNAGWAHNVNHYMNELSKLG